VVVDFMHRLMAATVALLSIGLAIWVGRREPRAWVRQLAFLAVVAIMLQSALGGLAVLFLLPSAVSLAHAGLAQLFFCLLVALAVATSSAWVAGPSDPVETAAGSRLFKPAAAVFAGVFMQNLLGVGVRHTGSGLAIPDFPLAFGRLIPAQFDFAIGIHFLHRLGALISASLVFWLLGRSMRVARGVPVLQRFAWLTLALVVAEGSLGGWVVLSGRGILPNTLHSLVGAFLLGSCLALALFAWRLAEGGLLQAPERKQIRRDAGLEAERIER
jgi:cytochrome c oxidase assembly protein subunit 15